MKKDTNSNLEVFYFKVGKEVFALDRIRPLSYYEKLQKNSEEIYTSYRKKYPKLSEDRLVSLIFIFLVEKLTNIYEENFDLSSNSTTKLEKRPENQSALDDFMKDLHQKSQTTLASESVSSSVSKDFRSKRKLASMEKKKSKEEKHDISDIKTQEPDLFNWQKIESEN